MVTINTIPKLKRRDYQDRYGKYSEDKRIEVVYTYLFEGRAHRWMDEHILGQEGKQIKGYVAMAILHHLGIVGEHKGIFKYYTLEDAIQILVAQKEDAFTPIIEMLNKKLDSDINDTQIYNADRVAEQHLLGTLEQLIQELDEQTKQSRKLKTRERMQRLDKADKKPQAMQVVTVAYCRNPDVVAEVLERADGICERCRIHAPFVRKSDKTPYLEVHHKIRLADGGEDTVENALAVCPNCHRELHYGI